MNLTTAQLSEIWEKLTGTELIEGSTVHAFALEAIRKATDVIAPTKGDAMKCALPVGTPIGDAGRDILNRLRPALSVLHTMLNKEGLSKGAEVAQELLAEIDLATPSPKPAVDALTEMEKLGREFKHYFGHITPEEALRAINFPASEPKALTLTDEQRKSLKYVIARLEIASVEDKCEHAENLRSLLADRAPQPEPSNRRFYKHIDAEGNPYWLSTPPETPQPDPATEPEAHSAACLAPGGIDDDRCICGAHQRNEAKLAAKAADIENKADLASCSNGYSLDGGKRVDLWWTFDAQGLRKFVDEVTRK